MRRNNRNTTLSATVPVEVDSLYSELYDVIFEVEAVFTFSPMDPGRKYGPPEDCYPPEGGEVLSCEVILPDDTINDDGETWLRKFLGDDGYEAVEADAFDRAQPPYPDDEDDRY
jgi:hypothetical protein